MSNPAAPPLAEVVLARSWALIPLVLVTAACATEPALPDQPPLTATTRSTVLHSTNTTSSSPRMMFPDPPVEDWWVAYRRSGDEEGCAEAARWSDNGDIHDSTSERGKHYLECLDQGWTSYFFHNWFDFAQWDLFTDQELRAIREDLSSTIVLFENLLAEQEQDSTDGGPDLLANFIDRAKADLDRLDQYLGHG